MIIFTINEYPDYIPQNICLIIWSINGQIFVKVTIMISLSQKGRVQIVL